MIPVHYGLYTDACGYDCVNARAVDADPDLPGTPRHRGDPETVETVGEPARPNVELHLLDDDHQLLSSLDTSGRHHHRVRFAAQQAAEVRAARCSAFRRPPGPPVP